MSFIPYIMFRDNCGEAMPPSDRIMHGEIGSGDGRLMVSDFPEGMDGDEQQAVSITHPVPDPETGRRIFDRLAEGGTVQMPFGPTFWSDGFGMVRDRFGTHWMISAPQKA